VTAALLTHNAEGRDRMNPERTPIRPEFDRRRRDRARQRLRDLNREIRSAARAGEGSHESLERQRDAAERELANIERPLIRYVVALQGAIDRADDAVRDVHLVRLYEQAWSTLIPGDVWLYMEDRLRHLEHRADGRVSRGFMWTLADAYDVSPPMTPHRLAQDLTYWQAAWPRAEVEELVTTHLDKYWARIHNHVLPSLAEDRGELQSLWHGLHTTACYVQLDFARQVARSTLPRLESIDGNTEGGETDAARDWADPDADDALDHAESAAAFQLSDSVTLEAYTDCALENPLGGLLVQLTDMREANGEQPIPFERIAEGLAATCRPGAPVPDLPDEVIEALRAMVAKDPSAASGHTAGSLRTRKSRFLAAVRSESLRRQAKAPQ
jgi:hypothetical protein